MKDVIEKDLETAYQNFVLKSILLSCHPYSASHTSENLSKEIKNVLQQWGVEKKIVFAVSDNAPNIKNALNILKLKNLGCFAHTLNLIVQSALKEESGLIDKVKDISTHFRKSTTAHHKLMTYQINLGEKQPKKMLQDVATRWNSTFYMLQRFVDLEVAIRGTIGLLDKAPNTLSPEEWLTVKHFCQVLSPFEEATKAISGEQYMTASLTIVIVQGLQNVCEQLKRSNYTPRTINLINNLVKGMNERQSWGNIQKSNTLESTSHLISLTRSEIRSNVETTSAEITSGPNERAFSIWQSIDTQVTSNQPSERTSTARAIIEVQRYMEELLIPRQCSPLVWWQEQKYNFPFLSILARRMLCCLSSSVPCERVFSKAGLILSDRRCRLNSKKAQMLLFLNHND
ncbi:zinc finger BED domain-containing protein 4-like [Metopolophium dirhodum]|uniref:zinc finger BED domain-containing protein 4-like n=1 Tax=Metopolophium dirhodum TaxID=44670 RepID=UPI00298FB0C6|nr:zinc finger BED domain-containing protein 4-like [Metopolophium dirhodum]